MSAARTFECPQCGALVRVGRLACPECGSDARTGWQDQDEVDYQSVEVPDGYGPDEPVPRASPWSRWWCRLLLVLTALALLWAIAR